jgi:hypothetical protein
LPAEPELPAEEIARLPSLESITAETDLTGFLRQGVPASLRKAALRRAWSLDPAIRDRVGDALDYAWDWNTPGGVPVSGPLWASDDVRAMLSRILGEEGSTAGDPPIAPAPAAGRTTPPSDSAEADVPVAPPALAGSPTDGEPTGRAGGEPRPAVVRAGETSPAPPRRPRHGGAKPV